jgi:hypothetical protein
MYMAGLGVGGWRGGGGGGREGGREGGGEREGREEEDGGRDGGGMKFRWVWFCLCPRLIVLSYLLSTL